MGNFAEEIVPKKVYETLYVCLSCPLDVRVQNQIIGPFIVAADFITAFKKTESQAPLCPIHQIKMFGYVAELDKDQGDPTTLSSN